MSTGDGDTGATPPPQQAQLGVASGCLPLSLPSSQAAAEGFQEELSPWVMGQHPLPRRTPMPATKQRKGRDKGTKAASAVPKQGTPQQCSPEPTSPQRKGHQVPVRARGLTLGFLLPEERLGDFSKETFCWVGGAELRSHHAAAGRELLRRVALRRGEGRGLVSTAHVLHAELPRADRSYSQPS